MSEIEKQIVIFISHANVIIDTSIPVPRWSLSKLGIKRHREFNNNPIVENITSIYSSNEVKAIEAAKILSSKTELNYTKIEELGEMDRSSTGYLIEKEFEKTVNSFFANPNTSIKGWEKGIDAQKRIVDAVISLMKNDNTKGNIAIVSHGGVGALLLSKLINEKISRDTDQPKNGGGNYFCFTRDTIKLVHGWKDISNLNTHK